MYILFIVMILLFTNIFELLFIGRDGGGSGAKGPPTLVGPKREHLGGKGRGERWV